jgi:hypothetical protein
VPKRCTLINVINNCCTLSIFTSVWIFGIAETGVARGSPPGTTTKVQRVRFPPAEIRFVSAGAGRAGLGSWRGRVRGEAGRQAGQRRCACVRAVPCRASRIDGRAACVLGRNRKGFTTSFLMRRASISAEALQLLAIKC